MGYGPAAFPIRTVGTRRNMRKDKFPASVPREMHWSDDVDCSESCPNCGTPLESEYHGYLMATRRRGKVDLQVVGNTAGSFCGKCPLVVLDRDEFEMLLALCARTGGALDYVVMGMVDFDAVPKDKRNLPFDDDTNPLPLVRFTNIGGGKGEGKAKKTRSRKANFKARKKRKRR